MGDIVIKIIYTGNVYILVRNSYCKVHMYIVCKFLVMMLYWWCIIGDADVELYDLDFEKSTACQTRQTMQNVILYTCTYVFEVTVTCQMGF